MARCSLQAVKAALNDLGLLSEQTEIFADAVGETLQSALDTDTYSLSVAGRTPLGLGEETYWIKFRHAVSPKYGGVLLSHSLCMIA